MTNRLNVYGMYIENGNKAGFYVRRNSWSYQKAKIISIGGKTEGELEGPAPYYGTPVVIARMEGQSGEFRLLCPGTYGYMKVS